MTRLPLHPSKDLWDSSDSGSGEGCKGGCKFESDPQNAGRNLI
jgi:hypothetical protein